MALKIAFIFLCLFLLSSCSSPLNEYHYNNTIIKADTYYYNNVTIPDCICNCATPDIKECDMTLVKKQQLQIARLVTESNYYRNLSVSRLLNNSYNNLRINLTTCLDDKEKIQEQLDKLKEILKGD